MNKSPEKSSSLRAPELRAPRRTLAPPPRVTMDTVKKLPPPHKSAKKNKPAPPDRPTPPIPQPSKEGAAEFFDLYVNMFESALMEMGSDPWQVKRMISELCDWYDIDQDTFEKATKGLKNADRIISLIDKACLVDENQQGAIGRLIFTTFDAKDFRGFIDDLRKTLNLFHEKIKAAFDDMDEKKRQKSSPRHTLMSEGIDLTASSNDAVEKVYGLYTNLEDLSTTLSQLATLAGKVQQEIEAGNGSAVRYDDLYDCFNGALEVYLVLKKQMGALMEMINAKEELKTIFTGEIERSEDVISHLRIIISRLIEQTALAEKITGENVRIKSELDSVRGDNEQLEIDLKNLNMSSGESEGVYQLEKGRLETEIRRLEQAIREMEQKLQSLGQEKDDLSDENTELIDQLESGRKKIEALMAEKAQLETARSEKESQIEKTERKNAQLLKEIASLQRQVGSLTMEKERVQRLLQKAKGEVHSQEPPKEEERKRPEVRKPTKTPAPSPVAPPRKGVIKGVLDFLADVGDEVFRD